ncbi:tRNA (adenosine(37)-N6)-threonylcarbamoyltransferase complex dimerization subunit type 1 TsaB [Maritimibacter dapengensis]|uniref:tRNA (Adenosine(37)-N6)-threonylcarbamoyltransferase complex dimerization subunit type 1 TsaB n=1 Tax=Maritimibacter dapengensis TaxID=2836868 RepID=A0ABS6T852_9RHOB|nr:tRNA (adenosine(37)-N6)-threonylcarbamoyltransferase complex dimerization subunit type 1 TsaB [Maritimibacter dapengensis]MBV7380687.1 tRNA (adenosine(37)-N6)-threonylcarbamoyltransferase complex dimerization subunit type 1 TsaB [Maritimibacter dapengensis]
MRSDPAILAFDTSAAHCAAALLVAGEVVTRSEDMARGQAEHLLPLIEATLSDCDRHWSELDAIAVGVGPGNFTGIRIAVAAARGLALGLSKPAIGISSLEAQAFGTPRPCLSVVDGKRGMAYVQEFDGGSPQLMAWEDVPDSRPNAGTLEPERLVACIARLAAQRLADTSDHKRPAPLYIRSADAAPASDQPPKILR